MLFWGAVTDRFGITTVILGFVNLTWIDFGLMLLFGLGNGYFTLILFTWIQIRTPKTMMGRMISLLTLSSAGLLFVSQAVSGAVVSWNLTLLFVLAGGLIVLVAIWAASQPSLAEFSESLSASD